MFISSIFKFVLYSTILGSMSAFLIFILKFLSKRKLQIKFINLLWLFLLIRLLIPWAPQTSFSIYNVYNPLENPAIQSRFTDKYQADNETSDPDLNKPADISDNSNSVKSGNTVIDTQTSSETRISNFEIWALAWGSVCILLITATALTTTMFYIKL
ncbi:hypothetical protein [Clostridium luticellarii]|nr:hypothetical protein [Clostridium luticellarii]MCI1946522.1 hypothetical protein [Clostridium luticellarii]